MLDPGRRKGIFLVSPILTDSSPPGMSLWKVSDPKWIQALIGIRGGLAIRYYHDAK
jgi:hypothetical protein